MKNKLWKKEKLWILCILLGALILYGTFVTVNPVTLWDENVYLSNARSHVSESNFTEDFRFPLLEYVIASAWFLTGESLLVARIIMILFSLASILAFYLITKEFFLNSLLRFTSTAIFALSPIMIYWSFRIYTDIPALCCMLFSIWLFLRYLERKNIYLIIGSGALASLAFLFRFPIILFALIIGIYMLVKKMYKSSIIFSAGAIIILIPWLLFNYIKYGNPIWDLLAQGGAVASYTAIQPISIMFLNLAKSLGIILLGLIPFIIWISKRNSKIKDLNKKEFFLIILSMLILEILFYAFVVRLKLPRYSLTAIPLIIILSIAGINWLANQSKKFKKIILYSIIILVTINILILSLHQVDQFKRDNEFLKPIRESALYIKNNYPSNNAIASNSWTWYAYYTNFRVTSTWTEDIDLLLFKTTPDLVALTTSGLAVNESIFTNHPTMEKIVVFKNNAGQEVTLLKVK